MKNGEELEKCESISAQVEWINRTADEYVKNHKNKRINLFNAWWYLFLRNFFRFLYYFIFCGWYKKGLQGFVLSVNMMCCEFLIYAKMCEKQLKK